MHFSSLLPVLALASSAIAAPATDPACPGAPAPSPSSKPSKPSNDDDSLYKAMKKSGREFIGVAVTLRNSSIETDIIRQQFNSMTPENAMKWESTEPARGQFTFEDADRHVAFARENKLEIHCHNLVWHSQLPLWVSNGNFTNATLIQVMEEHIKALATRWKGDCTRWDVVNEALNEDGTYRKSVWYDTIGEDFIPIAFRLAKKYDNHAKLYYNDYNLEYNGAKTAGAARIVKLIQSYGKNLIDGVGYQAHMTSEATKSSPGPAPEQPVLEAALRQTSDLGVNVVYTEIDVRLNTPPNATQVEAQVATYKRMAWSCMNVPKCVGMTVWGISDLYSWIPGVFPGEGSALLWDENYQKKPVYDGFLAGIKAKKTPNKPQ